MKAKLSMLDPEAVNRLRTIHHKSDDEILAIAQQCLDPTHKERSVVHRGTVSKKAKYSMARS